MRPRYIILGLALVAAAALVIMGPLRGRSVKETLSDLAGTLTAALPGSTGPASRATNAALPPPEITVSQPVVRETSNGTSTRAASTPSRPWRCARACRGYLTEVHFKDGQEVKQGDLLFVIDPRPFERALEQAQAELFAGHDQGRERQPRRRARQAAARAARSSPRKTFDDRENLVRDAQAAVKVAEAKVKTAELDLSLPPHHLADHRPHQPHAGDARQLGERRRHVTGTTLLTTIVSQDPIYIYFDVSENNYIKYKRLAERGVGAGAADLGAAVEVGAARRAAASRTRRARLPRQPARPGHRHAARPRRAGQPGGAVLARPVRARARAPARPDYHGAAAPRRGDRHRPDQQVRLRRRRGRHRGAPQRQARPAATRACAWCAKASAADDWVIISGLQRARPGQQGDAQARGADPLRSAGRQADRKAQE